MKKVQKKYHKIILTIVIVLAVGLGLAAALYIKNNPLSSSPKNNPEAQQVDEEASNSDEGKVDNNPPTDQQTGGGEDIKEDSLDQDKPTNSTSIVITSVDISGQQLKIRTLINKVTGTGNCSLSLTKGSSVITQTSDVQPVTSYSTCQGFSVDISKMETGTWTITLTYTDGSTTATATKQIKV